MVLSQEEIDGCREAFLAFDKDRSGTIDVWELRQVLEAMGQKPTEEELFQMISEVDENMSGNIDFAEFLKVIENQKERAENFDDESDMVDAFVACGGDPDKEGHVTRDTLIKIIKHDFGLTIDIEDLINKVDADGSGEVRCDTHLVSSLSSSPTSCLPCLCPSLARTALPLARTVCPSRLYPILYSPTISHPLTLTCPYFLAPHRSSSFHHHRSNSMNSKHYCPKPSLTQLTLTRESQSAHPNLAASLSELVGYIRINKHTHHHHPFPHNGDRMLKNRKQHNKIKLKSYSKQQTISCTFTLYLQRFILPTFLVKMQYLMFGDSFIVVQYVREYFYFLSNVSSSSCLHYL